MKSVKKSNKKSNDKSATATANASSIAQGFTVDALIKCSHKAREGAKTAQGIDLFALHSMGGVSKNYCAALVGKRSEAIESAKQGEKVLLICNGVANVVWLNKESGFYARNDSVQGGAIDNGAIFGNVILLGMVYGSKVSIHSLDDAAKLFAEVKEIVTRKVGSGKNAQNVTGRVLFSSGVYSVLANELSNGKLAFFNCESKANEYNKEHRFSTLKTEKSK